MPRPNRDLHAATSELVMLDDSDLELRDTASDIRRCRVLNADHAGIGYVIALLIDHGACEIRFLQVAVSGDLAISASRFMIPIEAVTHITANHGLHQAHLERSSFRIPRHRLTPLARAEPQRERLGKKDTYEPRANTQQR